VKTPSALASVARRDGLRGDATRESLPSSPRPLASSASSSSSADETDASTRRGPRARRGVAPRRTRLAPPTRVGRAVVVVRVAARAIDAAIVVVVVAGSADGSDLRD